MTGDSDEDQGKVRSLIDDALTACFGDPANPQNGIVSDWCVQVEVLDGDGEPYLLTHRRDGSYVWKSLGMVELHATTLKHLITG